MQGDCQEYVWQGEMVSKKEQISRMILDYLRRNPDAGDTLEGIAKWWLETERIESSVEGVADALESLVEQGLVRVKESRGGNTLYVIGKPNWFDSAHYGAM